MPIVYLIAGQGEREDITASLSASGFNVEEFDSVEAFCAGAEIDPCGCILLDLQPADEGVMRRLRSMCDPVPIIVLSSRANVPLAVRSMKDGAANFLQKPIEPAKLRAAVSGAVAESRLRVRNARRRRENLSRFRSLSARERDVLDAILDGRGNREVASQLGIKPRTVEIHRANVMSKLGARTLPEVVRIWLDVDANVTRLSAE